MQTIQDGANVTLLLRTTMIRGVVPRCTDFMCKYHHSNPNHATIYSNDFATRLLFTIFHKIITHDIFMIFYKSNNNLKKSRLLLNNVSHCRGTIRPESVLPHNANERFVAKT